MSEMFATDRACVVGDLVLGEVHAIIDEEYRYRGETRHRQRPETQHTAFCRNCGWNVIEDYFMDARAKGRAHISRASLSRDDEPTTNVVVGPI